MAESLTVLAERIVLEETCPACPEQYDAHLGGELVGYLRLRWGRFTVECPHVGDECVLEAAWDGDPYKGRFADEHERAGWLRAARDAIARWLVRSALADIDDRLDELSRQRAFAFEHRNYSRDAELAVEQGKLREQRVALCKSLET